MPQPTHNNNSSFALGAGASSSNPHVIGSGTNRAVWVTVNSWTSAPWSTLTVTVGGSSLTQIGDTTVSANGDRVIAFRGLAPASGSQTVTVTHANGGTWAGRCVVWDTAATDQSTPNLTVSAGVGTGTSASRTAATDANSSVYDSISVDTSATMIADTDRTEMENAASGGQVGAASRDTSVSNPETMNWTAGNALGHALATWAIQGLSTLTEQYAARFRNDDGNEATATNAAAENANLTAPLGTQLRLRVGINATGDLPATAYQLEAKVLRGGVVISESKRMRPVP